MPSQEVKRLAVLALGETTIEWVLEEEGVVVRERWKDLDTVEEHLGEFDVREVLKNIEERLADELKLPPDVRGKLKSALIRVGLPLAGRLVHQDNVSLLEVRGEKGGFTLRITYSVY